MKSDAQVILKTGDPAADAERLQIEIADWKSAADDLHWTTLDIREFADVFVIISNVIGYR